MLTGDNHYVAAWVARELELNNYYSEVLPHEKAETVKEIQKQYITSMVEDGVNDAPALVATVVTDNTKSTASKIVSTFFILLDDCFNSLLRSFHFVQLSTKCR